MTEQQTIAEFLAARLDEDEQIAQAAIDDLYGEDDCFFDTSNEHIGSHYLRHQPSRVLREIAAKRKIVEAASITLDIYSGGSTFLDFVIETLRRLAVAWEDHPDYDQAWRPFGEAYHEEWRP